MISLHLCSLKKPLEPLSFLQTMKRCWNQGHSQSSLISIGAGCVTTSLHRRPPPPPTLPRPPHSQGRVPLTLELKALLRGPQRKGEIVALSAWLSNILQFQMENAAANSTRLCATPPPHYLHPGGKILSFPLLLKGKGVQISEQLVSIYSNIGKWEQLSKWKTIHTTIWADPYGSAHTALLIIAERRAWKGSFIAQEEEEEGWGLSELALFFFAQFGDGLFGEKGTFNKRHSCDSD